MVDGVLIALLAKGFSLTYLNYLLSSYYSEREGDVRRKVDTPVVCYIIVFFS